MLYSITVTSHYPKYYRLKLFLKRIPYAIMLIIGLVILILAIINFVLCPAGMQVQLKEKNNEMCIMWQRSKADCKG